MDTNASDDVIELDSNNDGVGDLVDNAIELMDSDDEGQSNRKTRQRNWLLSEKLELLDIFKAKLNTETKSNNRFVNWIRIEFIFHYFGMWFSRDVIDLSYSDSDGDILDVPIVVSPEMRIVELEDALDAVQQERDDAINNVSSMRDEIARERYAVHNTQILRVCNCG